MTNEVRQTEALIVSRILALGPEASNPASLDQAARSGFEAALVERLGALEEIETSPGPGLIEAVHSAGLRLLLDVELDRFPIQHPSVTAHRPLFDVRRRRADEGPIDPRQAAPPVGEATARLRTPDAAVLAPVIAAWLDKLVAAGADGFRIRRAAEIDPSLLPTIVEPARKRKPDLVLIGDTLGSAWDKARSLRGFDRLVSSFAFWNGRAPWLAEEYEALRAAAPLLAEVSGKKVEGARGTAESAQLALLAAGTANGFILPATMLQQSDGAVEAALRLLETARGMSGEMRLFTTANHITVIVRADESDLRHARGAMLLLVNRSCDHALPREAEILAAAGADFVPFERVEGDLPPFAPLAAKEVRALTARRAKPILLARKPGGAKSACDAAARPRLVIEAISPDVDEGTLPAKCIVGDTVDVEATIYADGHEQLAAELRWRAADEKAWQSARMEELGNDRWRARFPLTRLGRHEFVVEAWLDRFGGFRRDFRKKFDAGVAQPVEYLEGLEFVAEAAARSTGDLEQRLQAFAGRLKKGGHGEQAAAILLDPELLLLMDEADDRPFSIVSRARPVDAERLAARFSSWYELFPRSQTDDPKRHGTFDDVVARLPQIRAMGFDTLYFPPIHPIGRKHRKGRNNRLTPAPDDPGSPYAIGSEEGGHDAIHPELGGFEAFRRLIREAHDHGLEIALDFAIQCSPDHPWLKAHPGWFDWRPDGTIKYAENPPKKYQDIVNVDFHNDESIPDLWIALRDVILFWIGEGVKVFRVDNPHTKPFAFWQWMIADVRAVHPDVIFLSEAFTRPAVMYRLAKIGFSQSYTYFTWRNSKAELTDYLTELTRSEVADFFRPHFFVNTPDINPTYLQTSGRAGFRIRAVLAGTLSGLFGVYSGFELCEFQPVPGKEEYWESEKYEIKPRDWQAPGNIIEDIARINRLRRAYPALQSHLNLTFYNAWNDNILYYGKQANPGGEMILVAVNLDPHNVQEADFEVPLWEWGIADHGAIAVEDLIAERSFRWEGKLQHMRLDPDQPYALWRLAPPEAAA